MTMYAGGRVPVGGFVIERPFCFTNWHSAAMAAAVVGIFAGAGWFLGSCVGFLTGWFVPDPEPFTKAMIVAALTSGAAKIGVVVGAAAGAVIAAMAQCTPCGSCYCFYYYTAPGTRVAILIMILPCRGSCTMIPPGCP